MPSSPVRTGTGASLTFLHLAWLFPFYPFLAKTQQEFLQRKFRTGHRVVQGCSFVLAQNLYDVTREFSPDVYIKQCIQKKLKTIRGTGLGSSLFFSDLSFWDDFYKRNGDHTDQLFRGRRAIKLIEKHEPLLLNWLRFIDTR